MPAEEQFLNTFTVSLLWRCTKIRFPFMGILMILVLIAAFVIFPSCGISEVFEDGEPDLTVPGGQSWSGVNWIIELDGAEWDGCSINVKLTITNIGDTISNFGYTNEDSVGALYIRDKFGEAFSPHKLFPWSKQFYEEKFYPDESRNGSVEYEIDARSEQINMLMSPNYTGVQNLSFELGDVPGTCE